MPTEKPIAILLNPSSGSGKARKKRHLLERNLRSLSLPHEMVESQSEVHLRQLVSEMARDYPVLAVGGGDSSLFIVVNELLHLGLKVPLGLIPLGSCNDLARELNLTRISKACVALKRGERRSIDVGMLAAEDKPIAYFPGQISLGLGVEVNRRVEEYQSHSLLPRKFPLLAGIAALRSSLCSPSLPLSLTVESKEGTLTGEFILGIFSNIRYYASGLMPFPQARLDDGFLDALLLPRTSFNRLIRLGLGAIMGRRSPNRVRYLRSDGFRISSTIPFFLQIDGNVFPRSEEPASFTNITISIIPAALEILV